MKKNAKILSVIVVLLILAGTWYYVTQDAGADPNVFQFQDGNLKVDLIVNLVNGEEVILTDYQGESLAITYEGVEVESLTYELKAMADTPLGSEPYDQVTLYLESFRLQYTIEEDFSDSSQQVSESFSEWGGQATIGVDDGYHLVGSWDWNFSSDILGHDIEGDYYLIIKPTGTVEYVGHGSQENPDPNDKLEVDILPTTSTFNVTYSWEKEVWIYWNTEVTWS